MILCALICAPEFVCALVCVLVKELLYALVCASKLACVVVCASKLVCKIGMNYTTLSYTILHPDLGTAKHSRHHATNGGMQRRDQRCKLLK